MESTNTWELRRMLDISKADYFGSKHIGDFATLALAELEVNELEGTVDYVDLEGRTVYFRMH